MFKLNQNAIIRYKWIFIILIIIGVVIMMATILPVSAQSTGTISGRVTVEGDSNQGIPNMKVGANFGDWGTGICTDTQGYYILSGMPLNTEFRMDAGGNNGCEGGANNYVVEFWQETPDWGSATPITLNGGNPDLGDIDFTLEEGGTVSGRVTDQATGQGILNMGVNAHSDGWSVPVLTIVVTIHSV